MRLQIQISTASQNRLTFPEEKTNPRPKSGFPFIWLILLILLTCIAFSQKPFIVTNPKGKPKLAKWRKKKLDKAIKDLDEAEQYVLLTKRNGNYPCYSCPNSSSVYLVAGQVWKYGFTTKSETGRYRKSLESKNLFYLVEYEGTITACMKEEKRKIYYYALLPENLIRATPLIRPPGNKQDN